MFNFPVTKKPIVAASYSLGRISSLKLVFTLGMLSFISWNISSKISDVIRNIYSYNYIPLLTAVLHAEFHKVLRFFFFLAKVSHILFFSFSFAYSCCRLFLNHFAWTPEGWIISKNNFYELGMNNLYISVNAIKTWKSIVSHTSCIIQIVKRRTSLSLCFS